MTQYLPDFLAVTGAACIVAGLWMIYIPAAFVIFGVACVFAGHRLA